MVRGRKKKVTQKKARVSTQVKNTAGGSTRTRTRKTQLKLSSQLLQMPVQLWQKLKELINRLLEKFKS